MRPLNAATETIAHQDRRNSIWNSWYALAMGLVPHPVPEHLGYEDWILTREARRSPMPKQKVAWLDLLMGREVQS